ncbi:MAG: hypothetical protein KTR31_38995 [Myxococcales bacterium]|nr:hypothetical protein [Myxococcales bacterium]
MDVFEAFVPRLRASAQDWEAWLVFADALADDGDVRQELIRWRHRRATTELAPEEIRAEERRIAEIRATHEGQWSAGLDLPVGASLVWRDGFVLGVLFRESVHSSFLEQLAAHPTGALWCSVRCTGSLGDEAAEILAEAQELVGVTSLSLEHADIGPRGAEALASSETLAGLRRLALGGNHVGGEGARALLATSRLGQLTELSLWSNDIDALDLEASATEATLRRLDLSQNPLELDAVKSLAEAPSLARLGDLQLWGASLGSLGAEALAASTVLRPQVLELGDNGLGDQGVERLVASDLLSGVHTLSLWADDLGNDSARALAAAPSSASLRVLDLANNRITDEGAQALASSPWLQQLDVLTLRLNDLTKRTARAVRETFADTKVRI